MFACLYVPPPSAMRSAPAPAGDAPDVKSGFMTRSRGPIQPPYAGHETGPSTLLDIARMVSPRVDARSACQVVIDVQGLERLVGDPRAIGERLRQAAADRGIAPVHVAVAGTCTAAVLLAAARAGVTVVAEGEEAAALAPLPLRTLTVLTDRLAVIARWGLRTLGELAALPPAELSERLGQDGIRWQRLARGEDTGPLTAAPDEEPFEASLELEWPIEDLEPLSFVLSRLLDPLCQRLERRDRGAASLHLRLRLVTRDLHLRSLQLPAPMRDPKVLRTLLLLDLEAHPAPAGIDAVTVAIDPTPGRIIQESLLTRALPAPELVSTLVARLQALMGEGRCGSPATVDSYRPGAFAMAAFSVTDDVRTAKGASLSRPSSQAVGRSSQNASQGPKSAWGDEVGPRAAADRTPEMRFAGLRERAGERDASFAVTLRRFRLPIPARVLMDGNRPVSVRTDRPALVGGRVHASAGPWRTSGEWWKAAAAPGAADPASRPGRAGWNRDEWDVALGDGGVYRIFEDRASGRWFVEAVVD